jgi:hypothetical protein
MSWVSYFTFITASENFTLELNETSVYLSENIKKVLGFGNLFDADAILYSFFAGTQDTDWRISNWQSPLPVVNTLRFERDITLNITSGSPSIGVDKIIIGVGKSVNGNGKTLTLTGTQPSYTGLFDLVGGSITNLSLDIVDPDIVLNANQGWLCKRNNYGTISGCSVTSTSSNVSNDNCGGLVGDFFGFDGGMHYNATITGCSFTGSFTGSDCSGIGSNMITSPSTTISVTNCTVNAICSNGEGFGGTCGTGLQGSGIINITNCHVTATSFTQNEGGGILGRYIGLGGTTINISNCSFTGNINATDSGGIGGSYVRGNITVNKCVVNGTVSLQSSCFFGPNLLVVDSYLLNFTNCIFNGTANSKYLFARSGTSGNNSYTIRNVFFNLTNNLVDQVILVPTLLSSSVTGKTISITNIYVNASIGILVFLVENVTGLDGTNNILNISRIFSPTSFRIANTLGTVAPTPTSNITVMDLVYPYPAAGIEGYRSAIYTTQNISTTPYEINDPDASIANFISSYKATNLITGVLARDNNTFSIRGLLANGRFIPTISNLPSEATKVITVASSYVFFLAGTTALYYDLETDNSGTLQTNITITSYANSTTDDGGTLILLVDAAAHYWIYNQDTELVYEGNLPSLSNGEMCLFYESNPVVPPTRLCIYKNSVGSLESNLVQVSNDPLGFYLDKTYRTILAFTKPAFVENEWSTVAVGNINVIPFVNPITTTPFDSFVIDESERIAWFKVEYTDDGIADPNMTLFITNTGIAPNIYKKVNVAYNDDLTEIVTRSGQNTRKLVYLPFNLPTNQISGNDPFSPLYTTFNVYQGTYGQVNVICGSKTPTPSITSLTVVPNVS